MQAAVDIAQPKNPIDTTEDCRFCWMCRQACPVGHVTARETLTPHGWALLIDSVKRGHITWTAETIDVLYACADCGLCRAHCITDRPLPDAITATRAELVAKGHAPAIVAELNERLLRTGSVYGTPTVDSAASNVAAPPTVSARRDLESRVSAPGAAPVSAGPAAGDGAVASEQSAADAGLVASKRSAGAAEAPASKQVAVGDGAVASERSAVGGVEGGVSRSGSGGVGGGFLEPPPIGRGGDVRGAGEFVAGGSMVGLFIGDAAGHLGGREVEAVVTLLRALGISPVLIGRGRSNGVVASSLGLRDTAVALARQVVADVEASGCGELLVLAPEDRFGFERVYGDRLDVAWPAGVRVREVSDFLAGAAAEGRLAFRRVAEAPAYAYHDPCHSARIDRDDAAPRVLLRAVLGPEAERHLFWRERRAHPCGAVGGLQFTQPAIAAKLADARFDDARQAGASWLITDDPGCAHHLRSRPQQDITVRGFYELLAEQLVS